MKEVHFVAPGTIISEGALVVDFGLPPTITDGSAENLTEIFAENEAAWKRLFIDWLGNLNRRHSSVHWWAHTTVAKNPLSSPVGNRVFQLFALAQIAQRKPYQRLFVVGASRSQAHAFEKWARENDSSLVVRFSGATRDSPQYIYARIVYQFLRVAFAFIRFFPAPIHLPSIDVWLFTYVDTKLKDGNDTFFGRLPELLREIRPGISLRFLAFIHSPYCRTLPLLRSMKSTPYHALYTYLRITDLAWALLVTLRESLRLPPVSDDEATRWLQPVLVQGFRWDIGPGGYFYNLLVYRAARRYASTHKPTQFIYPYECKSLERLLLLGVREGNPTCRIVGYQHTSITPRHMTLLFAAGEADHSPMPDRIITVGEITRRYLQAEGNYPASIQLVSGCALRQTWGPLPSMRPLREAPLRLLLALSSSRMELLQAIRFIMRIDVAKAGIELAIRPHPEFPLSVLQGKEREWVERHALDLSGSSLRENLAWCDIVAYVSSTVVLEAMMVGKPVINVPAGDILSADPVLGKPPLWFQVRTPEQLLSVLHRVRDLTADALISQAKDSLDYVRSYLSPPDQASLSAFLQ